MRQKILLKGIISIILSVSLCVLIYGFFVRGGSLTPSGAPGSTMFSLSDIGGSGFSSASHSLVQIKSNLDTTVSSRASGSLIGAATDAASMSNTLFAGQQYLWDNRASFGTAAGDATAANQTTILGRIGLNTDAASMSNTLFAGQQYIGDKVDTINTNTDNAYSAAYVKGAPSSNACGGATPSCASGWTSIDTFCTSAAAAGTYANEYIQYNDWVVCALVR